MSRTKYYPAVGGELFDRISQRSHFSERDAVAILRYVPVPFRPACETENQRLLLFSPQFGVILLNQKGHGRPVDLWSIGYCYLLRLQTSHSCCDAILIAHLRIIGYMPLCGYTRFGQTK
jgi:hypothetical protein